MEQKLLNLLSQALDVSIDELSIESSSENIEKWDSLIQMNIIFAVEDEFNIRIPDDKLSETTSVKKLLEIIEQG